MATLSEWARDRPSRSLRRYRLDELGLLGAPWLTSPALLQERR
jgi:hypothetical protein